MLEVDKEMFPAWEQICLMYSRRKDIPCHALLRTKDSCTSSAISKIFLWPRWNSEINMAKPDKKITFNSVHCGLLSTFLSNCFGFFFPSFCWTPVRLQPVSCNPNVLPCLSWCPNICVPWRTGFKGCMSASEKKQISPLWVVKVTMRSTVCCVCTQTGTKQMLLSLHQ